MSDERFAALSENQKQTILINKDAANTKRSTNTAVKCFKDYLISKGLSLSFEDLSKEELNAILGNFYMEARNMKGELYSKSTLISYRHGIQRHLDVHRSVGHIDITKSNDFATSKNIFKSVTKELKRQGKGAVVHHRPITDADLQKAYSYVVSQDTAKNLQYKVFLDVMLYFGRRGRENLAGLTRKDFAVSTDEFGHRYVYMTRDFATKNHQDDNEKSSDGKMYESTDDEMCPVKSFVKYIRRLNPLCLALFQQPRPESIEGIYYDNIKLGHNKLGSLMSIISREAGLSQVYTNHCCRATTVHVLDEANIPSRHIMTVTGHKSENSLKTYNVQTSNATMKLMSEKISGKMSTKNVKQHKTIPLKSEISATERKLDHIEPLSNSQCEELIESIQDFYDDPENIDSLLKTVDCTKAVYKNNVTAVSQTHQSMNIQRRPLFPMPVFNNCSNITINYNCS